MTDLRTKLTDKYLLLPLDISGNISCDLEELEIAISKRIQSELRYIISDSISCTVSLTMEHMGPYNPTTNPYIAIIDVFRGFAKTNIQFFYETTCPQTEDDTLCFIPAVISHEYQPPYTDIFDATVLLACLSFSGSTATDPSTLLPLNPDSKDTSIEEVILRSLSMKSIKIGIR